MSIPALKFAEPVQIMLPDMPNGPSVVGIDGSPATWAESPARILHERLLESFAPPEAHEPQVLPARVRLAILVGSVTLLWSAIGGIVALML